MAQPEQLDLLARNQDDWWLSCFLQAVKAMAATQRVFQTYDLVTEFGLTEPDDPKRWGAAMRLAHKRQIVMPVSAEPSRRPTVAGSLTRTWRGYVAEDGA